MFIATTDPILGFLQTTIVIFSISDTTTWALNTLSRFCVRVHVVVGYFILTVLVILFAGMF